MPAPYSTAQIQAQVAKCLSTEYWGPDWNILNTMLTENDEYLRTAKADTAHGHDGSTGTVAVTICTSATRPSPYTLGGLIVESDTGYIRRCTQANPALWSDPLPRITDSQIIFRNWIAG